MIATDKDWRPVEPSRGECAACWDELNVGSARGSHVCEKRLPEAVAGHPAVDDRDGKWTCSTDEERFDCSEEFDTEAEAHAYAISEHCPGYGVADGNFFWTGRIAKISVDELAQAAANASSAIECMETYLWDNVGEAADDGLDVPNDAEVDLDRRLADTFRQWMLDHKIEPRCWRIEKVKQHVWQQCRETHPDDGVQCLRHLEHDGECEWP